MISKLFKLLMIFFIQCLVLNASSHDVLQSDTPQLVAHKITGPEYREAIKEMNNRPKIGGNIDSYDDIAEVSIDEFPKTKAWGEKIKEFLNDKEIPDNVKASPYMLPHLVRYIEAEEKSQIQDLGPADQAKIFDRNDAIDYIVFIYKNNPKKDSEAESVYMGLELQSKISKILNTYMLDQYAIITVKESVGGQIEVSDKERNNYKDTIDALGKAQKYKKSAANTR